MREQPLTDFRRTIVSEPGAAILEVRIEYPDWLKQAIALALEAGKRAAGKA